MSSTLSDTVKTNTLDTLTTSANMLIGNATNTGKITIATINTGNTNADPAISIGADAGIKTIKINNNTHSVHCSSIDIKGSAINNITGTTGALSIGDGQTSGILNLGTNVSRTGDVNIGTSTNTGKITIATVNTGNTNADPAISIGADAGTKTIKINNNTNAVHCSSIDLKGSAINNITGTSGGLAIGDLQTSGILNLGTNSARTGDINIGSSTNTGTVTVTSGTTVTVGSSSSTAITNINNPISNLTYTTVPSYSSGNIGYILYSAISATSAVSNAGTETTLLSVTLTTGVWYCSYGIRVASASGSTTCTQFLTFLSHTNVVSNSPAFPQITGQSSFGTTSLTLGALQQSSINTNGSSIIKTTGGALELRYRITTAAAVNFFYNTSPSNFLMAVRIA